MNDPKDVLVVDDEPSYRTVVQKKLKGAGYNPVLVQNAEEALGALWEKERIGLVLLDIRLPMVNGMNIFEMIRKEFPNKKIIVVSVLQKEEQKFLILDADDYYDKSEDLELLVEKVGNVLHNRAAAAFRENDKRHSRRLPVNVLASCERWNQESVGSDTKHFIAYTRDMSIKGGKFILSEGVKPGQYFTASLELPMHFLPVLVDCEVRWTKKMDEFSQGGIEAGVKFVKLDSSSDEEKLKSYLTASAVPSSGFGSKRLKEILVC